MGIGLIFSSVRYALEDALRGLGGRLLVGFMRHYEPFSKGSEPGDGQGAPFPWLKVRRRDRGLDMEGRRFEGGANYSEPPFDRMREHAAMDLFRWYGVSMIPTKYWELLPQERLPARALAEFCRQIGIDSHALRSREREVPTRFARICHLLVADDAGRSILIDQERLYLAGLRLFDRDLALAAAHEARLCLVDALFRLEDVPFAYRPAHQTRLHALLQEERRRIIGNRFEPENVASLASQAVQSATLSMRWLDAEAFARSIALNRTSDAGASGLRQIQPIKNRLAMVELNEFNQEVECLERTVNEMASALDADSTGGGIQRRAARRQAIFDQVTSSLFENALKRSADLAAVREHVIRKGMIAKSSPSDRESYRAALTLYETLERA